MKYELRFRQVHLDFHTSEHIPDVGRDFDPEAFARTLAEAHVDSVTCFARCHHGWLYYDSKALPECVHPSLKDRDLLKRQIEACHRRGIRAPVYTTVQWDDKTAREHGDWLALNENGAPFRQKPFEPGFYRNLCLNTPYVDYLKLQIRDMFDCLGPLDGVFLDILNIQPCCCPRCLRDMTEAGLDAEDEVVRWEFAQRVLDRFKRDMTAFIHDIQPDCPVFYNAGFIGPRHRGAIETFTHLEIESLPGGPWGYDHFPATARYARTLGLDFLGMTGKFHTDWGDFGSFRNPAALEYECFKSLAYGGKCSIGDQLHPCGVLTPASYRLIGGVYAQVEAKEPWCRGAVPVTEAAVMIPAEFRHAGVPLVTPELVGAVRLLTDIGLQFNVVDSAEDLARYRLLVLPDDIPLDAALEEKLASYLASGGKALASFRSGLRSDGAGFSALMPVEDAGEPAWDTDYIASDGPLGEGLEPDTEYVMYRGGRRVRPAAGARELLRINAPFFNRTWRHFSSHRQTPSSGEYGGPAAVAGRGVVYFAHPVFGIYDEYAPRWVRTLVSNAVRALIGPTLTRHDGPVGLELCLNDQPDERRLVLHALYYVPARRSRRLDILEDVPPLFNVRVELTGLKREILSARLVPGGAPIPVDIAEDGCGFTIPEIRGHQMVALEYR